MLFVQKSSSALPGLVLGDVIEGLLAEISIVQEHVLAKPYSFVTAESINHALKKPRGGRD